MLDKQLIAKVSVFVLLGVNVGAYYLFWPHQDSGAKREAKLVPGENGEARLLPAPPDRQPPALKPKTFPASSVNAAVPLSAPRSVQLAADPSTDETVNKLLSHIKKETEAVKKAPIASFEEQNIRPPANPLFPETEKPRSLPPLQADPLVPSTSNPNIGVTSALTPKTPAEAWIVQMETLGNRKLLTAKLSKPGPAIEFSILCDRVETKGPEGDVHAVGKITFTGPGFKGACQRLTLRMREPRLMFEEALTIEQDALVGSLRGEQLVWDLPAQSMPANLGVLGAPK
jgi:hypothetical protein